MPLYIHKRHGWQLVYTIYFPSGRSKDKFRYFSSKTKAVIAQQDAERLETLTSQGKLTRQEALYFANSGYISAKEANSIIQGKIIVHKESITWDRLKEAFIQHITTVGTGITRSVYPSKANVIINYFKDKDPAGISVHDIEQFVAYRRKKGIQKSTVNKDLTALRIMMDYLLKHGYIASNPARQVRNFTDLEERVPRPIFPEEFTKFVSRLRDYAHHCQGYFAEIILTYLYTGMRRYELILLKNEHVNLTQKYLIIEKSKNKQGRVIDIHPKLEPVLRSVIAKNDKRTGKYFFGAYDHPIVTPGRVTRIFSAFVQDVGLPGSVTLRSLRHTFITYLLGSGVDLKRVMEYAGHRKLITAYKYIHLIPQDKPPIHSLKFKEIE